MTVYRTRRSLYRAASILGDVEAVQRGPRAVGRRIFRKAGYRFIFGLLRGMR